MKLTDKHIYIGIGVLLVGALGYYFYKKKKVKDSGNIVDEKGAKETKPKTETGKRDEYHQRTIDFLVSRIPSDMLIYTVSGIAEMKKYIETRSKDFVMAWADAIEAQKYDFKYKGKTYSSMKGKTI